GVAVSIKHFPGDGVDERDQHLLTSVNSLSPREWDDSYGKIYSSLINAGAKTVMVGHIALPSYQNLLSNGGTEGKTIPASLSRELMRGLLREKLGFNGLVVTDASPMAGFRAAMKREYAVPLSIENGADMFLFARDLATDYKYMTDGVKNGILSEVRLNEAVTRILALKASLRLHVKAKENGLVPSPDALKILKSGQNRTLAAQCADESVTLIKDRQNLLPISPKTHKRVYLNVLESSDGSTALKRSLKQKLTAEGFEVTVRNRAAIADLCILASPERTSIFKKASVIFKARKHFGELVGAPNGFTEKYDLAIYVAFFETASENTVIRINWKGFKGAGDDIPWFVNDVPTMFISLANPYHLLDVPMIKTYINAYTNNEQVIDAVIDKILGRSEFKGVSPVDASCGREDVLY
ncbi:MAG: glycoside hydrolase family 3 protein, partial [Clostridiales bacterium]|nr:glycoside hydrolase family 3 protein [Clostridiales bacterium]